MDIIEGFSSRNDITRLLSQKAWSVDTMEYGLNGRKIGYGVIKTWLYIMRVIKKVVQNANTVVCFQEGPASWTCHIRLRA